MTRKTTIDMTRGNIAKSLLGFALPLVINEIFMRLYTAVDTWVVGNYVSDEAFAAVGSVSTVSSILVGICTGFTGGAAVVVSQYFGAKNKERIHDSVHTSIAFSAILGVALTVVGYFLTPVLLRLTKTPDDVFGEAKTYLQIYFLGMCLDLFYGILHHTLRTAGNYRVQVLSMTASGIANTILDLLFVIVFHWGVAGVAWATTISKIIPAVWATISLHRNETDARFRFRELKLSPDLLKVITALAIPTALQRCIGSLSNTLAQRYINAFGKEVMGAWTIHNRLESIVSIGATIMSYAVMQFVGQNLGAGLVKRTKKGVWISMLLTQAITVVMIALVILFREPISYFFNQNPETVQDSAKLILYTTPFYIFYCADVILGSSLRGAGDTKSAMICTLFSYVVFRQIYLYVVSRIFRDSFVAIVLGYPAGWMLACTLMVIHFCRAKLEKTRVVKEGENRNDAEDKE